MDAARGLALFGMMAIHVLPAADEDVEPTLTWLLFAGKAAALFALLAGVTLAFTTRKARTEGGHFLAAARWSLAARAGLVTALGLAIAYVDMDAFIILAYYGAMFLLAVPLLGVSTRTLFIAAAGFALLGPALMQGLRDYLPAPGYDPTFSTVVTEPGVLASQLLLTGTYPAIPWLAYIAAGLAIGRMSLDRTRVQLVLLGSGAALAAAAWFGSRLLLAGPGFDRLLASEPYLGSDDLQGILVWGTDGYLPTSSWWWLSIAAPHSTTPFDLLHTMGVATGVLGAMLLVARFAGKALLLLSAPGRMTLTLYCTHLLFLGTGALADLPEFSLWLQIIAFVIFAVIWQRAGKQGPLEKLVSRGAASARDSVLRRHPDTRSAKRGR
ncbi:heparan-alpha-glucosaminide N-acetyltransferase domain-containing protein [Arthrobacter sp. zg-Y844]|uniref:heparan-alpha-glucosaminide N-acetyltransferase domain-containing protein n=1 Tax=Arthrobacter sp. zg-Y844 TaxID=2964612 RepID=UPI00210401A3|nr:heparan-alpha-glucosaminide N-acetyltransferase domain-containing protein [Arthrobacter sp. zg-Y844]